MPVTQENKDLYYPTVVWWGVTTLAGAVGWRNDSDSMQLYVSAQQMKVIMGF